MAAVAKSKKLKKVLVLGSGALKIGEAGEFDYSGSQAMKALKEQGLKVVLINPNIATIQTSPLLADRIYFLPVTPAFVEQVIAKERPDGILLSFGGQTALNCGVALHQAGVLQKYGVKVLGTPIRSIILTEDRKKFAEHLRKNGQPVPESEAVSSVPAAIRAARHIGYPVMVRSAYSLGGQKSGVAYDPAELEQIVRGALQSSPQVLIEQYLKHFKEVEYEVVRDAADNSVTVCNMENMDPLGIHTGESVVVAPSQTLDNYEYHTLRRAAIDIVRSLGIVGECNIQFAINPKPKNSQLEYYVIEVNARLSRSSALASKATGYPLAYVAALLALGKLLSEVRNGVTRVTKAFFEPALDYVVVKIPRWDLEKFKGAEERIGSSMKSVGEVMAIGRTFEEALQKAVRMLHHAVESLTENGLPADRKRLRQLLSVPTPKRLFAVAEALRQGLRVSEIYKLTGIDPWFLSRIKNIVRTEEKFAANPTPNEPTLRALKELGFSDERIGRLSGKSELQVRKQRQQLGVLPSVFQIDTLAGEFPARTNYLYLTYVGRHHDVKPLGRGSVMVLGSGPYHIGSSVEFDWSCVHTALALKKFRKKSIIINSNPETVSTDYDMSDRLYFEDLNFETVADIADFEREEGVVISVGGQTPNNLALLLAGYGIKIFGTAAKDIDRAEDRNKFSKLLDRLQIPQPEWGSFSDVGAADRFARKVGYPVLVRPSYVLSGSAMGVCYNKEDLTSFLRRAAVINRRHPVTVSKFMTGAKELELDAVAQAGRIQVLAISEHIENAGVHSGDATIAYPAQRVYLATAHEMRVVARRLAHALKITGPFNIQFLVKEQKVYVIEINLRASRTFPFLSKATGVNFAEKAVEAFYGRSQPVVIGYPDYVAVKSPQFSFSRLLGADPVLRVEMASTGEVASFGNSLEEALLKSISASVTLTDKKAALLSIGGVVNKTRLLPAARLLHELGYQIYATGSTCRFLREHQIQAKLVYKVYERKQPGVLDLIHGRKVAFVINLSELEDEPEQHRREHVTDGYLIRRAAVEAGIPLLTDFQLARWFARALAKFSSEKLAIKPWSDYVEASFK